MRKKNRFIPTYVSRILSFYFFMFTIFNRNYLNIIYEYINIHIHIQSLISRLIVFFYYFINQANININLYSKI